MFLKDLFKDKEIRCKRDYKTTKVGTEPWMQYYENHPEDREAMKKMQDESSIWCKRREQWIAVLVCHKLVKDLKCRGCLHQHYTIKD